MIAPLVGVERRIGQRFSFNLPVSLRDAAGNGQGLGFTQDVSSRGVFLFTDMTLAEGAEIELTLKMPSEITLGESMRVRCRGRVLRVVRSLDNAETKLDPSKFGVAVCLTDYEYLPSTDDNSAAFRRISALHTPAETERRAEPTPSAPRVPAH
ncbi:MAG: PilZ domain-containing protein [Candidatus Sulfotelmatobacter sp.]